MSGFIRDQAELQGLLQRVSDLGLTLLEVKAADEDVKRNSLGGPSGRRRE